MAHGRDYSMPDGKAQERIPIHIRKQFRRQAFSGFGHPGAKAGQKQGGSQPFFVVSFVNQ